MNFTYSYQDDCYPFTGVKETRDIARALLKNPQGDYAIHHVVRNDIFGSFDYYETPGGGVDEGESFEEACRRECYEETGFLSSIDKELGSVKDYYNLIERENHQRYFLCHTTSVYLGKHFVSGGDRYIVETLWLAPQKIVALYEKAGDTKLIHLVRQRELPFWKAICDQKPIR